MKKIVLVALFVCIYSLLRSQVSDTKSMFLEDITAKPFLKLNTEGIEGSPYLNEAWLPGVVTFENGNTAKVNSLRFSPYNNTLYFLRNNETYEFVEPVKQFELHVTENSSVQKLIFRSGYPSIDRQTSGTFYQLLKDDSTQLLKLVQRTIEDYKAYNQPVQQKFIDRIYYYSFSDGKISRVKKR